MYEKSFFFFFFREKRIFFLEKKKKKKKRSFPTRVFFEYELHFVSTAPVAMLPIFGGFFLSFSCEGV